MISSSIQQFYLRALYTEVEIHGPIDDASDFVLRHMDLERLRVERAARLRNLRTVLHGNMYLLSRLIDKKSLLPIVQAYASSELFWQHRGRTLVEDFCMFYTNEWGKSDAVSALVAKVEGVYSGLSASIDVVSPWPQHYQVRESDDIRETFLVPFAISWDLMYGTFPHYQPSPRPAYCQIFRQGDKIKISFTEKENTIASSDRIGSGLPA